jgi:4-phytase/acid phosphatase
LSDVGWNRIKPEQLQEVFRLHTAAFDLEQRTPYIAKRQGSFLLKEILLALQGNDDHSEGTAPPNAKFVAYIGHDTNIFNIAAMLGLSWQQQGYQKDQTPPAGALMFELHEVSFNKYVSAFYVAQSLDNMRKANGAPPVRTPVPIPGCGGNGHGCMLKDFGILVGQALDPDPDCSQ